jgi:hypothetical protein
MKKNLLAARFYLLHAPEHPIKVEEDRGVMSFVKDGKSLLVPLLGAAHEVFVAGRTHG